MVHTLSYQLYKCEHGLNSAEQRAVDVRAGEAAVALRDLKHSLGSVLRLAHRVRSDREAAGAVSGIRATGSAWILSNVR